MRGLDALAPPRAEHVREGPAALLPEQHVGEVDGGERRGKRPLAVGVLPRREGLGEGQRPLLRQARVGVGVQVLERGVVLPRAVAQAHGRERARDTRQTHVPELVAPHVERAQRRVEREILARLRARRERLGERARALGA